MLYISYPQVIHAAWLGSACHTPVAISGTCGTFGLPVLTSVLLWTSVGVHAGTLWAYMDRHKPTLVIHNDTLHTLLNKRTLMSTGRTGAGLSIRAWSG